VPWDLSVDDIERVAIGAGILGTGGGGNPRHGALRAKQQLAEGRRLRVISLDELPDDALVVPLGGMGAPTVGVEKMSRGDEGKLAIHAVEEYLGHKIAATIPVEIGGGNSFAPMIAAAQVGLPTVDADGMGRAFPEGQMVSFYFDGSSPRFLVMIDALHRKVIIENVRPTKTLEVISRAMCVQMGGTAMVAEAPLTVKRLRETCIPNTITLAHRVGDAVLTAQQSGTDPIAAVCKVTRGRILYAGKITDVDRRVERGYNFGHLSLFGLDDWQGSHADIDLQNEYLICRIDGVPVAIVPDLITLVDSERGTPITTEVVRYGLRVTVLGIPAPAQLKTEQALQYVGPRAFGYDLPFSPLQPT
jgi:DUF917 family protein